MSRRITPGADEPSAPPRATLQPDDDNVFRSVCVKIFGSAVLVYASQIPATSSCFGMRFMISAGAARLYMVAVVIFTRSAAGMLLHGGGGLPFSSTSLAGVAESLQVWSRPCTWPSSCVSVLARSATCLPGLAVGEWPTETITNVKLMLLSSMSASRIAAWCGSPWRSTKNTVVMAAAERS